MKIKRLWNLVKETGAAQQSDSLCFFPIHYTRIAAAHSPLLSHQSEGAGQRRLTPCWKSWGPVRSSVVSISGRSR